MDRSELDGVRAIVTGSSRGLGEAIARDLVERGAFVLINGTDAETTRSVAWSLSMPNHIGSVADGSVVEAMFARAEEVFGGVDLLVNNAGITQDALIGRATVEEFDAVIGVNLKGTWLCCRAAAQAMKDYPGQIVNVVSGTALFGNPGQSVYAAAKGGVLALTRTLAVELQRSGIRVNAIAPVVKTTMVEPLLKLDESMEEWFGEPADVAPVVALLASPAAAELNGAVLGFNGRALTVWSHPDAVGSAEVSDPRDLAELSAAFASLTPESPNPDAFGQAVLSALKTEPLK